MLEKDIISYKKCENEDEKMDFLSDYDSWFRSTRL